MKMLSTFSIFLLFLVADAVSQNSTIYTRITSEQMKAIFQSEGFTGVEIDSDDDLIVKMKGYNVYVIVSYSDYTNIQYMLVLGNTEANLRKANDFNQRYRFGKVSINDNGDPVLKLDLDLTGGVTVSNIVESISTFNILIDLFLDEVVK